MTKKRFTLAYEKGNWWAVRDGCITLWKEEVIYLLNQQDQRIQELESDSQWDDERLESIEGLLLEYENQLPPNLLKEFYEIKEGENTDD